ncbi:MAG: DUF4167 domain-containing protein [Pseudomonadota bacterium]
MRHGSSSRRQRNRGGNSRRSSQNRNRVFDSNGPDVRIRGTAHQVAEKYEALAKDARSEGDSILAESYMQHAEHYQRMIVMWNEQSESNKKDQNTYSKQDQKERDLSLPNSILGDEVQVNDQQKAEEKVLETA